MGPLSWCYFFLTHVIVIDHSIIDADYAVQFQRDIAVEELGCEPAALISGLSVLTLRTWILLFPLLSISLYGCTS
jgi:hypothetical protein